MRWLLIALLLIVPAQARDDGRYANSANKAWFDSLVNKKNAACCSVADGLVVEVEDIEMLENHYWVTLYGKKHMVPDDALVLAPNIFGRAVVWPVWDAEGNLQIRCFIAGAGG